HSSYTFFTELCHFGNVCRFTDRCEVEFEVACVDDITFRCSDDDTVCFRDRVCNEEEIDTQIAELQHTVLMDFMQFRCTQQTMLFQFVAYQPECKRAGIY